MIQTGKTNILTVIRETEAGLHLSDDDKNEVLLPNSFIKSKHKIKEKVTVFVYTDSEERLIATVQIPYAELYEFALLRAVGSNESGVFLDWGIEKDLFVPYSEQKSDMEEG